MTDAPRRIVCLTEETTEVLYLLGEDSRIVGVSGFTARPPEARSKPKVSAFTSAKYDRIMELEPDLVIGFSNLQAEIARELIQRGVNVLVFNQRSVEEILAMILTLSRLVGAESRGQTLLERLRGEVDAIERSARRLPHRPRVFFEEWNDPLISGIRWCSELIEVVGGDDVCVESRRHAEAKGRIYDPAEVARRDPEVVIASWCGRKASREKIRARPGWSEVTAVREDQLYEIKSSLILQPGPAALSDGVDELAEIVAVVARGEKLDAPGEGEMRRATRRSG